MGVVVVTRGFAILNLLALVCLAGCADTQLTAPRSPVQAPEAYQGGPEMSAEALRVSQIAERNGDRDFLMLDKAHGQIIAFQQGRPTFSGAALTGENPSDYLAPDAFTLKFRPAKGFEIQNHAGWSLHCVGGLRPALRTDAGRQRSARDGLGYRHSQGLVGGAGRASRPTFALVQLRRQAHHLWLHRRRWVDDAGVVGSCAQMKTTRRSTFCHRTKPWLRNSFRCAKPERMSLGLPGEILAR